MKKYLDFSQGQLAVALDRFNHGAGDQGTAFDPDFHLNALRLLGVPFREVHPIAWRTAGRSVAGVNEQADVLRQTGMRTFRRLNLIGVSPGSISITGDGCAVLDFSEDGQVVHFSSDRSQEPVEMPLADAIDAAVDLYLERFGGEVQA
ncbi:hypothetical protein [Aeromonas hydrophila]|uniref:hypothetical protein n=1 Tax=Aeromonas hydrophila TaxID=644 RepID=UPI00235FDFD9|nr:hypothetical protein [Aeromonas hydrophila]